MGYRWLSFILQQALKSYIMPFWHVKKQLKYPHTHKIHTPIAFFLYLSSIFISAILSRTHIPTTLIDPVFIADKNRKRKLWSQQQTNPQEHWKNRNYYPLGCWNWLASHLWQLLSLVLQYIGSKSILRAARSVPMMMAVRQPAAAAAVVVAVVAIMQQRWAWVGYSRLFRMTHLIFQLEHCRQMEQQALEWLEINSSEE